MSESSEVRIVVESTVYEGADRELERNMELLRLATGEWGIDLPRVEGTMSSFLRSVAPLYIPIRVTRCRAEAVVKL